MVRAPLVQGVTNNLNQKTRTNMFAMVWNRRRAVWKNNWHLDSCDIWYNSDSKDSRDSWQGQSWLQDFATVCISGCIRPSKRQFGSNIFLKTLFCADYSHHLYETIVGSIVWLLNQSGNIFKETFSFHLGDFVELFVSKNFVFRFS